VNSEKLDSNLEPSRTTGAESFRAKIHYRPITSLKRNPRNARSHPRAQRRKLRSAVRKFGFINPVIVDETGTILVGHERVEAAREEGYAQVPVIQVDHLTPAEKRAYALADNKLAELAGWDTAILAAELRELWQIERFDIQLTGFEMGEIDVLLREVSVHATEETIPTAKESAVTRLNDIWLLGKHRLKCSDATDPNSFVTLMGGRSARIILSDPPYNVRIDGHASGLGTTRHADFLMAAGEMSEQDYIIFLERTLRALFANSLSGAVLFIFIDWRHVYELIAACRAVGCEILNICVWTKTNAGMGSLYRSQHEFVVVLKFGDHPHINNVELGRHGRYRTNVWSYPGMNSFGAERTEALAMHPTVKPVALVEDAILDCSNRGDVVLDPFIGSGTTIVASEQTGRICYGMELDPRYVDVAVERFWKFTGVEPVHETTGQTFTQLARSRAILPPAGPADE
jgi:DNA modification methylase